ncbi:MAG: SMC-Scp complex subunit ScpB [Pseudomonadales bacterium]
MSEQAQLKRIIEGALLAAGEPLSVERLSMLFADSERPAHPDIRAALKEMVTEYEGRGFELKEVASGWRFQVCQDLGTWVSRLWEEKPARYSRALLETLALMAYRQPVTRGEIEEVRGVSVSSNIIRTLLEREWIRVVGHRDVPGRPAMYATTKLFLDYFNLKTLSDLPSLAEIRDLDKINAELNFADMAMDQAESKHEQGAMIDIEEPFEIVENEDNDMTSQPQVLD